MKKNALETLLYSIVGVAVLLLVLVAVNIITSVFKQRIDFTKDRAYTLSDGTRKILAKIKTPVKIRFYYTAHADLPPNAIFLRTYAQHVQDMLSEYKVAGHGKVIIEQLDPQPDSDAEDAARLDGIEGQPVSQDENFYLGASVKEGADTGEVIPFFRPDREQLLEYDLSRAISQVVTPEKPVIGIMSGENIFGTPSNPMMEQMGQQGRPAWALVTELKDDFDVRQVEMTADKIDDDIKVLLVVRPKEISDKTQYAIDQFILRGGKLVAFLDTVSLLDKNSQEGGMMGGQMPGGGSSLDKLIKAWGLNFDMGKAVADLKFMNRQVHIGNGDNPCWIQLSDDALNKDDVVTSDVGDLWVPFSGAFTGTPVAGLKETVLLKSSTESQLVDSMMSAFSGDNVMKDFKPSGTSYALAVRLTGHFKTAFPNGPPTDPGDTNKPAGVPSLKESTQDGAVALVGSSDMFADEFSMQQIQTPLGNYNKPVNGNLDLAQSLVENLAGDSDLISVRSRATSTRPFTRIEAMQAKADEAFQSKINEYAQSKQETEQKLEDLQKAKDPNQQRFILSPEQQAEIDKLRRKEVDINRSLKQTQKELRREVTSTENWLKWGNIIGMPLLVAVSGLGLAGLKRKRTSAK